MRRSTSLSQLFLGFDYVGTLLLAGSLACCKFIFNQMILCADMFKVVVGLTWGGSAYAWSSAMITGLLVGGCIGLVVFGLFEWKIKKTGALLDHRLFTGFNFPVLCFICLIDGMLLLGINVLYSQEIAALFGGDPIRIATILSPYLITSTLGCLPAGWIMGKTKSYRPLLIGSLVWCALFTGQHRLRSGGPLETLIRTLGLMAYVTPSRLNYGLAFSALFGIGTAVTTVIPSTSYLSCACETTRCRGLVADMIFLKVVALTLSVPPYLLGTAGTLSISARALGGITGITIYTSIFNAKFTEYLPGHILNALSSLSSPQKVTGEVLGALASGAPPPIALSMVKDLPPSSIPAVLGAMAVASSEAYRWVWLAIA